MYNIKKILLIFILMLFVIGTILGVFFSFNLPKAYAETILVDFNSNGSWFNGYSKFSSLTSHSITLGKENMKITSAELVDPKTGLRQEISNASGNINWTGTITANGIKSKVRSEENKSTKGYYAWYRYSNSTGENLWQADFNIIDESYNSYGDHRICTGVGFDETSYTNNPACSFNDLTLTGQIEKNFYLVNGELSWIDLQAISIEGATIDISKDNAANIPGPQNLSGITHSNTTIVDKKIDENFKLYVWYSQDFSDPSLYYKLYPIPDDKLMVYFAAFTIDITAHTYFYNHYIEVTYEPLDDSKPDLTPINIATTDSLQINSPAQFTFKFRNQGREITKPFTVRITNKDSSGLIYQQRYIFSSSSPLGKDAIVDGAFTYTFSSSGTKTFRIFIDSGLEIDEGAAENNNTLDSPFTVSFGLDGEFDIVPNTIKFREPFTLKPKPFTIPTGCNYISHQYKLEGFTSWITDVIRNRTADTNISYAQYLGKISVGTTMISLNISTDCGDSGWIRTKPLAVTSMTDNSPPQFNIGWFQGWNVSGLEPDAYRTVVGSKVNLRVIRNDFTDPPTPYDPDKDPITFTWDFASSESAWIHSLGSQFSLHEEHYKNITADTLGTHRVRAIACDPFGACSERMAVIEVIPPNPIPVAACPAETKSGRTIPASKFDSLKSFSPVGRTINHALSEWINKQSTYLNPSDDHDITVQATLSKVVDSSGLASLAKDADSCDIIVHPDPPPVAKLVVPPIGIRNVSIRVLNRSYSPDNDPVVSMQYFYKYDSENDGFENNNWTSLPINDLTGVNFTPTQVGKYWFRGIACEQYKCGDTIGSTLFANILNVVSDAPEVSYMVRGINPIPETNTVNSYNPSTIMGWDLYDTNTNTLINHLKNRGWTTEGGYLKALEGKSFHAPVFYEPSLTDYGLGSNGLSPYRSIKAFEDNNSLKYSYRFTAKGQSLPVGSTRKHIILAEGDKLKAINIAKMPSADSNGNPTAPLFEWQMSLGSPYYQMVDMGSNDDGDTIWEYVAFYPVAEKLVISDKTVYVTMSYRGSTSAGYEVVRWNYTSLGSYDALTGTPIARIDNFNVPSSDFYTDKDELVIAVGDYRDRLVKYNRNLGVVSDVTLPKITSSDPSNTSYGSTRLYQDANGAFYKYEYYVHNSQMWCWWSGQPRKVFQLTITKINPDFSIAWRTNLGDALGPSSNFSCSNTADGQLGNWVFDERGLYPYIFTNHIQNYVWVRAFGPSEGPTDDKNFMLNMATGSIIAQNSGRGFDAGYDIAYTDSKNWGNPIYPMTHTLLPNGNLDGSGGWSMSSDGSRQWPSGWQYNSGNNWYYSLRWSGGGYAHLTKNGEPYYYDWSYPRMFPLSGGMIADGVFLGVIGTQTGEKKFTITKGIPADSGAKNFFLGQFVSPENKDNFEVTTSIKMSQPSIDANLAGFSFRMTDPMNRYALETDGRYVFLSRYVAGNRVVLRQQDYYGSLLDETEYSMKIKAAGDKISVWFQGVPLWTDVQDGAFATGKLGHFTDKPYVSFGKMNTKIVTGGGNDLYNAVAIWENGRADFQAPDITYTDPENDPQAGAYRWSYVHTPKFLHNQGFSSMNGIESNGFQPVFDKVGFYDVTLRAKDDPHPSYRWPSMVFNEYRKDSNSFKQTLVVHRRPVAQFTLIANANGTISWNDTSYDPDRFDPNNGACSAPDVTGYNYCVNRGVLERKYSYLTPSGAMVVDKLTRVTETGTYTVYLQVKDEYGAWSYQLSQDITGVCCSSPNVKPGVTLTYPTGTQSNPTLVYTTRPTSTWNQWDSDGGILKAYNIRITDETGASVTGSGEMPQWNSVTSWTPSIDLQRGQKYGVQVQVSDGESWSDWSTMGWMKINSPPAVSISSPSGIAPEAATLYIDNRRPSINWIQSDPNWNYFKKYHIQFRNNAGASIYEATNWQTTSSTTNTFALPEDLPTLEPIQVRIRVTDDDENLWSAWSNTVWLAIDRTPSTSMITPSGSQSSPTPMSPTPNVQFRGADPDAGNVFTKFQVQFMSESSTLLHDSGEISFESTGMIGDRSYQLSDDASLPPGAKVRVRARMFDGYVWSAWSAPTWLLTNRPPAADFDWSPKPVWEGDLISITNLSTDPDGNPLTSTWSIVKPDNSVSTVTTHDVTQVFHQIGTYKVTLTVSDGFSSSTISKDIPVQELTLQPDVFHTPEWLDYHERNGHETATHPKEFYSGEIILVQANTSPAAVTKVEAWIEAEGRAGNPISITTQLTASNPATLYKGNLHDDILMSLTDGLPEGNVPVYFRVTFSNGTVKEDLVSIRIIGNIHAAVNVHRRQ